MNYSYIIIDDNHESTKETKTIADGFCELNCLGFASNYFDGLNLTLEKKPDIIFLEIDPKNKECKLSLEIINPIHHFLKIIPKIIVTTSSKDLAFEAIQYDVLDYVLKPVTRFHLNKIVSKLNKIKETQRLTSSTDGEYGQAKEYRSADDEDEMLGHAKKPLMLCIKSYGDYRYIDSRDITYFQADNNSTDIHLNNGEMITAFKTLKYFEGLLSYPFVRIHNSYIVNSDCISRIHTGNTVCYIKNTTIKLPFSKSYKVNIDFIIWQIASGNYLEI